MDQIIKASQVRVGDSIRFSLKGSFFIRDPKWREHCERILRVQHISPTPEGRFEFYFNDANGIYREIDPDTEIILVNRPEVLNKKELQEILWLIEQRWHSDFLKFVETGEGSNEFFDYLDSNSDAQRAIGLAFTAQARALEYVAKLLKIDRLVNHYFRGKDIQKWLNAPHPMLDDRTPRSLMDDGHADAVLVLLESVRDGIPL